MKETKVIRRGYVLSRSFIVWDSLFSGPPEPRDLDSKKISFFALRVIRFYLLVCLFFCLFRTTLSSQESLLAQKSLVEDSGDPMGCLESNSGQLPARHVSSPLCPLCSSSSN